MRMGIYACVALLAGCATADRVPLDNGREGFAIECPRMAQCYKKAAKLCAPSQYEMVDKGSRTQGTLVGGIGSVGQLQNITVICKQSS